MSVIPITTSLSSARDALITRTILSGTREDGTFINIPTTVEGHIETAIHDPSSVFGDVTVSQNTPIIQYDFVYGLNTQQIVATTSLSGSVSASDGLLAVSTGTTQYAFGVCNSDKRIRYRVGQGMKIYFEAIYTTPVINSYQDVGCGTPENGIYFGYGDTNALSDTSFGIFYVRGGKVEIKTLTVTVGATSSGNVTITLNGTAFTVAVTNASNIQRTVYEIATATYAGWFAYPKGATVIFVKQSAGVTAGTQSFSAGTTGASASIAQTRAGVASTDTFVKQSNWNVDKCDGTGVSGFTLNPQKLNMYRFKLGYGSNDIVGQIKITPPTSNNNTWSTVHTIKYSNLNTQVNFTNPSMPFNVLAYSAGSTTNLTVNCSSVCGIVDGKKILNGPLATYSNVLTSVGAANFQALFTILNPRYYNSVLNQTVINIRTLAGAIKHTSPVIFYIIKNGTLLGNPNFGAYSTTTCGLYDTSATTITYSTNDQLLYTFHLGDTGNIIFEFGGGGDFNGAEFVLQPGDYLTLAAKATTGTPPYVTGSLNTREDQ